MNITRHYLTITDTDGPRRVHYRRCGSGPTLLMVHQSPRSSSEYEALMLKWGAHFTCIAPDTPGFGQSDPLTDVAPEIEDFADALVAFAEAVGITSILGYGFHSGGIMLVTAMRRHMARFTGLAIGGYAVWNDAERAKIGPPYIPPNPPTAYGEHLVWLWNRILEQSWYFPWFEPADANRMAVAHADVARIDVIIQDMLNSGDAYRFGYGAVLRAGRDILPANAITPPVRITAYAGDPLAQHLSRITDTPANWEAYAVATPQAHQDASLAFLLDHRELAADDLQQDAHQGFLPISTPDFSGLIHWLGALSDVGRPESRSLFIHAPGREADLVDAPHAIRIDLPGHGLSSGWLGEPPEDFGPWQRVIDAVTAHFGATQISHEPLAIGDPERLFPDLSPDRFGHYLTKAWAIVRAQHIFAPWFEARAANAIIIDEQSLDPVRLAKEHRALIRANAARALHIARTRLDQGG